MPRTSCARARTSAGGPSAMMPAASRTASSGSAFSSSTSDRSRRWRPPLLTREAARVPGAELFQGIAQVAAANRGLFAIESNHGAPRARAGIRARAQRLRRGELGSGDRAAQARSRRASSLEAGRWGGKRRERDPRQAIRHKATGPRGRSVPSPGRGGPAYSAKNRSTSSIRCVIGAGGSDSRNRRP